MILINDVNNKFTFKDIVYISENSNQILSLMKLYHEK